MGAEHLLGKGDMLFLPPGSSRLVRVHGSYVSEAETNDVVEFWKQQAQPDYDKSFLIAPVIDDEDAEAEDLEGPEDPMYQEAVRVICEMGKASTSTLQRFSSAACATAVRCANTRYDAARWNYRPARRQQASRGAETSRLADRSRESASLAGRYHSIFLTDVETNPFHSIPADNSVCPDSAAGGSRAHRFGQRKEAAVEFV